MLYYHLYHYIAVNSIFPTTGWQWVGYRIGAHNHALTELKTRSCTQICPPFPHYFLSFSSCAFLNTCGTWTWKITHLVKLQHSGLFCNLGLTLTSKRVRLKPTVNFLSGLRHCWLRLLSLVFRPNRILVWFKDLACPRHHLGTPSLNPHLLAPMQLVSLSNWESNPAQHLDL